MADASSPIVLSRSAHAGPLIRAPHWLRCWTGPLVLLLAGAFMLAWTWNKWPDPLVDYGRELYVAWQLAEGKVLYRDVAYVQGPLSPYLNALWFKWFGVGLRALVTANLIILAVLTGLLYRLLVRISDRFAATMAGLLFLTLFAFVQFGAIGNYNYVCPYRHEVTHGMTLALAALTFLEAGLRNSRVRALAGAGLCLGLVALTKAEFFLATATALGVALALGIRAERPGARRRWQMLAAFLGALVVPPLLALLLLATAMPAAQALQGVFGSWPATFHAAFQASTFVRRGLGTLDVAASLATILKWTLNYAVIFLPAAGVGLALRTRSAVRWAVAAGLIGLFVAWSRTVSIHWSQAARPLPLVVLLLAVIWFTAFVRRRADPEAARRVVAGLGLTIFAGMLLAKMALNTRIHHYGFVLAMPATLLLIVALLGWIPAWIERRGGFGWAFRGVALTALALAASWYLNAAAVRLRLKTHPVGVSADAFLADERGVIVNAALEQIRQRVGAEQTLAVLPEGAMLNYLSRRSSPTAHVDFVPTEMFYFGEDTMLDAFKARPPDYIALVHSDTSEFGFQFFGRDYGRRLSAWIQQDYREVAQVGHRPLVDERFGILLLEKNP